MMKAARLATAAAAILCAAALFHADAFARDGGSTSTTTEVRLQARLSGPVINNMVPEGKAEYRERSGRRTIKVEAEDVNVVAGTQYTVTTSASATPLGTITIGPLLEGEIELDARTATVPVIAPGVSVTVTPAAGGAAILTGVFK